MIGGSDGMALTAAGSYASVGNPGTTPSITEEEAMAQAVSYGEASWPDAEVSCTPDASSPLVIWPDESGGGRLAYLGQLLGEEAGEILIDAGTGDVLAYSCTEASPTPMMPAWDPPTSARIFPATRATMSRRIIHAGSCTIIGTTFINLRIRTGT